MKKIPYKQIKTLFLDAGNTLISMDFGWIIEELGPRNMGITVDVLRRAEAASRPALSKELARLGSTEREISFFLYVRAILRNLPGFSAMKRDQLEKVARELTQALKKPRTVRHLWTIVMPNVPEALRIFRQLGLQLVVVSNSDGTIESLFRKIGLRDLVDIMVDSGIVGFEKPDPRIFHHALRASNATPEQTLHVGDFYDVDVLGARAVGIHALLMDPFGNWKDLDCESMPDLLTLANHMKRAQLG